MNTNVYSVVWFSLELRVPFLDHRFTAYYLSLPEEMRIPKVCSSLQIFGLHSQVVLQRSFVIIRVCSVQPERSREVPSEGVLQRSEPDA